jgi:hypothetical protein
VTIQMAISLEPLGYASSFRQGANPFDLATCMCYTGIDPFTKEAVYVARGLRDRKLRRALMQFLSRKTISPCGRSLSRRGDRTSSEPAATA